MSAAEYLIVQARWRPFKMDGSVKMPGLQAADPSPSDETEDFDALASDKLIVIGLFDRLSPLADLDWLLKAYAVLPETERTTLVLGCLETEWPNDLILERIDSQWPNPTRMPDLILLEDLSPAHLPELLAQSALLLSVGIDDTLFLEQALSYPIALIFAATWPHRQLTVLPGCFAYDPESPVQLQQAWLQALANCGQIPSRQLPVNTKGQVGLLANPT
jgi:hypothetical protein